MERHISRSYQDNSKSKLSVDVGKGGGVGNAQEHEKGRKRPNQCQAGRILISKLMKVRSSEDFYWLFNMLGGSS